VAVMTSVPAPNRSYGLKLYSDPDGDNTKTVWLSHELGHDIEANTLLIIECTALKSEDKDENFRRWRIVDDE
jgi:hypothetical protein